MCLLSSSGSAEHNDLIAQVDRLILLLADDESRPEAIEQLIHIGGPAIAFLERVLSDQSEESDWVRWGAVRVLERIGGQETVPLLIYALTDRHSYTRKAAADALGRLGDSAVAALPGLVNALADSSVDVRRAAAQALGLMGVASDDVLTGLTVVRYGDPNTQARWDAQMALNRLQVQFDPIPRLIDALSDERWDLMAVRAIAEQKTETEAVLSMLEALVQGELDPERRIAFLRALVELSAERATPILIEALSGPDLQLRREAVALLSNVGFLGEAEILALIAALSDPDAAMRQDVLYMLERVGMGRQAVNTLMKLVDSDEGLRQQAVKMLGEIGPEASPAIPSLVRLVESDDRALKLEAIKALGNIAAGSELAARALADLLIDDSDTDVQREAAYSLAALGSVAVPYLENLVSTASVENTRWRALMALRQALAQAGIRQTSDRLASSDRESDNTIYYYVSPQGNDGWSGTLPAPSSDGTDGPFASITRAQSVIRAVKAETDLTSPITVYIREGVYHLPEPIVFTHEDSGTIDCPITYAAYPGETPILSGGRPIDDWQETSDGVWVAKVPHIEERGPYYGKWEFSQLFVNGRRASRTRLPRSGYYYTPSLEELGLKPEDLTGVQVQFSPDTIDPNWTNLRDVEVVMLRLWIDSHLFLRSVDVERNVMTVSHVPRSWVRDPQTPYYVLNVREALAERGEWYYDREEGLVYYKPMENEDIETAEAVAPLLRYVVRLRGEPSKGRYIEYLNFKGLTFSYTEHKTSYADMQVQGAVALSGAVYATGIRRCIFEGNRFVNLGNYGLEVDDGSRENLIVGNEFAHLGGGAIKLTGGDASSPMYARTGDNHVTDNYMHNMGEILHQSVGILARHTDTNLISHNEIHDTDWVGISVGWVWGYSDSVSVGNRVEYNHLWNIGIPPLYDHGAIYLLGVSPGTIVRRNLIRDVYGSHGIYLDEGCTDVVVTENVVYNTRAHSFNQNYGKANIVKRNVLMLGGGAVSYNTPENHIGFTLEHNAIVTSGKAMFHMNKRHLDYSIKSFASDYNLFFDVAGSDIIFGEVGDSELRFDDWQAIGYDLHSIVADPLISVLPDGSLRVEEGSFAHNMGVRSLMVDEVGPRVGIQAR
jgi:HEAT repeat protein